MFNTVAHCTTAYYYVQVLRTVAAIQVDDPSNEVLVNFVDFKTKFLTIWGLVAQLLLFALCVVHDVARLLPEANPLRRSVRAVRDVVMVGVSGPMAVTVAVLFWSLWFTDRELVMPAALDAAVPSWLNHCMHSFVVVLVVVEVLAEPHRVPRMGPCIAIGAGLFVAYASTFFGEYAATGRWLYPVFAEVGWPGRMGLVGAAFTIYLVLIVVIRAVVRARWGDAKDNVRPAKKRKD